MSELPPRALEELRQTHAQGRQTLKEGGHSPESLETAIEVERHRWHWRPPTPRLLLVAESHVFTTNQDVGFRMDGAKLRRFLLPGATLPPERLVRLVYCLAYGESDLLEGHPLRVSNPGTPAYWDILGRVTFRCPQPRREDGMGFDDRMRWKIDTLRQLYRMGIWLLDASVHAIYLRHNLRLPDEVQKKLHSQWWKGYGRFLIEFCNSPPVWVIGKTVRNCLANLENWRCRGWIYQPTARGVDLSRNWPQLLEDCWRLGRNRLHGKGKL